MEDFKRSEIYVLIYSKKQQQRAIEILKKYGEKIWENPIAMEFDKNNNRLLIATEDSSTGWLIIHNDTPVIPNRTKIRLKQLEEILKKRQSK